MSGLTERELEIERLREQEGLSFTEIAKIYSITPTRASQIYKTVLRYRRAEKRNEAYLRENAYIITLELKLGEAVILQRILRDYQWARETPTGRLPGLIKRPDTSDIDYMTAIDFVRRIGEMEVRTREFLSKEKPMPDGLE